MSTAAPPKRLKRFISKKMKRGKQDDFLLKKIRYCLKIRAINKYTNKVQVQTIISKGAPMKTNSKTALAKAIETHVKRPIGAAILSAAAICSGTALADNPLVSHVFTADPAVRYYDGRFYVMASHDKDGATSYDLSDYFLFSSDDLVNWQDHGIVFDARGNTTWATQAYAPDWIKRNDKYYLVFPNGANNIGILEAEKPEGPYRDLIGRALITRQTPNANVDWLFDPGVFVDDDNTMYVYFGGGGPGNARVIKLSDDLQSTVGSAITIDAPMFFEAPYMFK